MKKQTPEEIVTRGYQLAFGRDPRTEEQATAVAFLERQTQQYAAAGKPDAADLALVDLAQALFSLNELVYID